MIYAFLEEIDEEMKCFELILRKYPSHPLIQRIEERVAFRLSERAKVDRKGAFIFSLLALCHLPHIFQKSDERKLLQNLLVHLEMPYFFHFSGKKADEDFFSVAVQLSFWLCKPKILGELAENHFAKEQEISFPLFKNVLLALGALGFNSSANELLVSYLDKKNPYYKLLEIALNASERSLIKSLMSFIKALPKVLSKHEMEILFYLIHKAMRLKTAKQIVEIFEVLEKKHSIPEEEKATLLEYRLWALLLSKQWQKCKKIFEGIPIDDLSQTGKFIHLLYGCYLLSQEGQEIARVYLSGVITTAFPKLYDLLSHFLIGKISLNKQWMKNAFFWEKVTLFNQLTLYYNCLGKSEKAEEFEKKSLKILSQKKKEQ